MNWKPRSSSVVSGIAKGIESKFFVKTEEKVKLKTSAHSCGLSVKSLSSFLISGPMAVLTLLFDLT